MTDGPKDSGGQGQADGSLDDRVGKLETGQDSLASQLNEVLSILKGGGGEGHADEPTGGNVSHEIRQQLDERDRRKAAEDKAKAGEDRIGALETKVSELAEQKPEPLPRRVERLMGWTS